MFTGIVEELGEIVAIEHGADSAVLRVRGPLVVSDATHGASISVNGVCLTVVEHDAESFTVDVMAETLSRSSLGDAGPGVTASTSSGRWPPTDRFGGHIVQGHVDGTARILDADARGPLGGRPLHAARRARPLRRGEGLDHRRRRLAHGRRPSTTSSFSVSLIPTTLGLTTLGPQGRRRPRQPRGRRHRQVRRAPARPARRRRRRHRTHQRGPRRTRSGAHGMNILERLFDAQLTIAGHHIFWREIVGNVLRVRVGDRRHAPSGLGVAGRHRRQRHPVHRLLRCGLRQPAGRDALRPGRASGLLHHHQHLRLVAVEPDPPAARQARGGRARRHVPRWATTRERCLYLGFWVGGVVVVQWLFSVIGAGWPAPRWYFWCDAWIFVGSIVATYAMARGWNDFWLAWIAVDLVGVPAAGALGLLPLGRAVRGVRGAGPLRLLRLAAGLPHAGPRAASRARCAA